MKGDHSPNMIFDTIQSIIVGHDSIVHYRMTATNRYLREHEFIANGNP